ncbi:MAG: iron complex outermembrane recepter protein [Candidatus Magnetoglobus multicellularis str. Araruama]|uniref:Iron complex outermembrane recepter protein n=1 Tax=Candidatus Magnetoglobus multicellularis str. Araruama TaxID=890399 RepID=A0A1V1P4U1_9BACT|nr:MAG: iron complex outermembrane recepter protein [Candidatus Magnetoglobus multicellularis str. Araruama]
MDEIVVSGEKIDEFINAYPHQVVGLSADEIKKRNFMDAYEALSTLPGVDIKQSSGLSTRISIRGSGGSGPVLILIDGRPINTSQYGGVDLSTIPVNMIKSITVFKPPAPVWLGPGSSAGAICIETKKAGNNNKNQNKGRIRLSGGSYGVVGFNGSCKSHFQNHNVLFAAGYNHRDGKRVNHDKDTGNVSINWDYQTPNVTQYQMNAKYYHTEHGVSGPTYNPTPNARQRYDKFSLDAKIKGLLANNSDYEMKLYGDVLALEDHANAGDISTLDLYKTGLTADYYLTGLADHHDFRLGGFAEYIQIDHTMTGEHHRSSVSFHLEHTVRFDQLMLTTGIRGDYTNDFDSFPAANAGFRYQLTPDTQFKGNIGYCVNLPSFGKLYQPSHGSIDQVRGNPDLSEETIISGNLSFEHTFSKDHTATISIFHTDTKDLIQYHRGEDLISRPENIDRAYKQGAEISWKVNLLKSLAMDANYVWQQTQNTDTERELTYAPQHKGKLNLKYHLPTKTRFELIVRAYSSQFTDTENTVAEKLEGYIVTDSKIIQPFKLYSYTVEGFIHISNLLDREFAVHYGYPDDGIRVIAGMTMNF